ncbi:MAG: hypothetical protein ACI9DF_006066 [Verrucomicrobiales bacterium]|jgi:hypothetical protein
MKFLYILAALLFMASASEAQRSWIDDKGRKVTATYIEHDDLHVTFEKARST